MTSWLVDTLLYTGVLIAVVLLLRRPVARTFGPKFAYALWALPALRLVLPPVVLPASMAPAEPVGSADAALALMAASDISPAALPVAEPAFQPADLLLPLWLAGAVAFLAWRIDTYLRMRRELLAEARPMGEVGSIRIVETPAVESPVAFGVFDKVVALPPRFMVMENRVARDLAIAHELEHHRGRDLAANFAAQLLLALHWFNPLAWLGWRAMRRDQEAACDARVLESRGHEVRAAYASVIAGFAAGPRLALAAPMACPVLGEKSIIHRLRSLSMSEVSPRRRLLGRLLLAGGAVTVPLTASVSYAAVETRALERIEVPPSNVAQRAAPETYWTPEAPQVPEAPETPATPEPPTPPEPPVPGEGETHVHVVRTVHTSDHAAWPGRPPVPPKPPVPPQPPVPPHPPLPPTPPRVDAASEVRRALAESRRARDEARIAMVSASRSARAHEVALAYEPEVVERCDSDQPVTQTVLADGRMRIAICHSAIERQAQASVLMGLRAARDAIARNGGMSDAVRREVTADLDKAIAQIEAEG